MNLKFLSFMKIKRVKLILRNFHVSCFREVSTLLHLTFTFLFVS